MYLEAQDLNPHLCLAFVSVVTPTTCSTPNFQTIVADLLQFDKENPVRLKLNIEAKNFFESVAVAEAFTDDRRYIEFINALFPEGSQDPGVLDKLRFQHEKHPFPQDEIRNL